MAVNKAGSDDGGDNSFIERMEPDDYEIQDSDNSDDMEEIGDKADFFEFDDDHFSRKRGPSVDYESFSKITGDDERVRWGTHTEMENDNP